MICFPFVELYDPETGAVANQILAERGYPRPAVRVLRLVAGIGLWYQIILWEDIYLDLNDVLAGYSLIAAAAGLVACLISWAWGAALLILAVILFLLAYRGLGRPRHERDREKAGR